MVKAQMLAFLININGVIINVVLLSQKSLPALILNSEILNSEIPLPISPGLAFFQLF